MNYIRLIGTCNPYRKKPNTTEKCGLTIEDDEEVDNKEKENLVYKANELPQSLLYYTYSFGSITEEDEKKYINAIIKDLFSIDQEKNYMKKQLRLYLNVINF